MKKSNGKRRGFTLVELVIVIAVIAILAAILVPVFSGVIKSANVAKYQASVNAMNTQLVSEAAATGIDYYTISTVRQLLSDSNFDLDGIPEGHSLWYDQSNFNLRFLANDEVKKLYQAETSGGAVTAAAGVVFGGSSAAPLSARRGSAVVRAPMSFGSGLSIDLPYRPEALTPNPDLLFLGTSAEDGNAQIHSELDKIYNGETGDFATLEDAISVFYPAGIDFLNTYKNNFDLSTTAYVDAAGKLKIPTSGVIANIVVSRNATKVETVEGTTVTAVNCAIELPEYIGNVSSVVLSAFQNVSSTFVVGKDCVVQDGNYSATILRPNRGKEVLTGKVEYTSIPLTEGTDGHYTADFSAYYARKQGGIQVAKTSGSAESWWNENKDENGEMYFSKYATPLLAFDVSKIAGEFFKDKAMDALTVREICYADWSRISLVATYWDGGTLKGRTFEDGIGYVTDLSAYTTATSDSKYTSVTETENFGTMGLKVELPAAALSYLKKFDPENLQITADYQIMTNVYEKKLTAFGTEYYELLSNATSYGATVTAAPLTGDASGSGWTLSVEGNAFEGTQQGENFYYAQSLFLNRIVVKDNAGKILLVRYFNDTAEN